MWFPWISRRVHDARLAEVDRAVQVSGDALRGLLCLQMASSVFQAVEMERGRIMAGVERLYGLDGVDRVRSVIEMGN